MCIRDRLVLVDDNEAQTRRAKQAGKCRETDHGAPGLHPADGGSVHVAGGGDLALAHSRATTDLPDVAGDIELGVTSHVVNPALAQRRRNASSATLWTSRPGVYNSCVLETPHDQTVGGLCRESGVHYDRRCFSLHASMHRCVFPTTNRAASVAGACCGDGVASMRAEKSRSKRVAPQGYSDGQ